MGDGYLVFSSLFFISCSSVATNIAIYLWEEDLSKEANNRKGIFAILVNGYFNLFLIVAFLVVASFLAKIFVDVPNLLDIFLSGASCETNGSLSGKLDPYQFTILAIIIALGAYTRSVLATIKEKIGAIYRESTPLSEHQVSRQDLHRTHMWWLVPADYILMAIGLLVIYRVVKWSEGISCTGLDQWIIFSLVFTLIYGAILHIRVGIVLLFDPPGKA